MARPDCVTENTGCTVELAQLGNTFLDELLATVLLNHVQHEAVVRGSFAELLDLNHIEHNESMSCCCRARG